MADTSVLGRGLALMTSSPFKASLPTHYGSSAANFNVNEALISAEKNEVFSDVGQYLKKKGHLKDTYRDAISFQILQNSQQFSGSLHSELSNDLVSSHLKIKLLAEYALSNAVSSEKLLNIDELSALNTVIGLQKDTRREIKSQLNNNSRLIENALSKPGSINPIVSIEDSDILRTLNSSNEVLLHKLSEINDELEENLSKLNNQYILALSLCYFEDLNINSPSNNDSYDGETEELMSYIASIAVQRNITLPIPQPSESKSKWARDCLDTILANTSYELQRAKSLRGSPNDEENDVKNLKTALKDLQFAHNYLTRQYEDERNLNNTVLETHKKKKLAVEKKLSENVIELERANQRSILIEHEKQMLEEKLDEKLREIHDLQKQVTSLKIENLGFVHGSLISPGKENQLHQLSPTSPLTGVSLDFEGDAKGLRYSSNPKTPLLQQNFTTNIQRQTGAQSPKFNSSISVLRKEFKRLVSDMHNDFEMELEKEKTERKRLQNLLKLFEERHSQIDL